jgi:hypothetical protein
MLNRRDFILTSLGILLLPAAARATTPDSQLLSPVSRDGKHFAAGLVLGEQAPHVSPLPMRGHGMLIDPRRPNEALVIARRPGTQAIKVDIHTGQVLHQWQAEEDRHFYGHAVYSADGKQLFFTENNVDSGKGLVSVRDANDFRVLAEYPTHGIGPHELLLMPDGVTLAVANGGILTLPETGRVKLNRGHIKTSLVYIDSRDGKLLGKYTVPSTQQSLRHLAVTPDGRVAAALQFEGDKNGPGVPLMMFHRGESEIRFADAPQEAWDKMRHYAASIAWDPASKHFVLSCPSGNLIACWSADEQYAGTIEVPKVSGIAFDGERGYASNELGEVYQLDIGRRRASLYKTLPGVQWDNHLYLASLPPGSGPRAPKRS